MLELDSISRAAGWQEVSGFFVGFFFSALLRGAGRAGLEMNQLRPQHPPPPYAAPAGIHSAK